MTRMLKSLTPSVVCLPGTIRDKAHLLNALGCERVHVDVGKGRSDSGWFNYQDFGDSERTLFRTSVDFHVYYADNDWRPRPLPVKVGDAVILHVFPWTTRRIIEAALKYFSESGAEFGLAVDLNVRAISALLPYFPALNSVLVMGIPAGARRHPLDPRAWARIHEIHELHMSMNRRMRIGIDGGVNSVTFNRLANVVDFLVLGSLLFDADDLTTRWELLVNVLAKMNNDEYRREETPCP